MQPKTKYPICIPHTEKAALILTAPTLYGHGRFFLINKKEDEVWETFFIYSRIDYGNRPGLGELFERSSWQY